MPEEVGLKWLKMDVEWWKRLKWQMIQAQLGLTEDQIILISIRFYTFVAKEFPRGDFPKDAALLKSITGWDGKQDDLALAFLDCRPPGKSGILENTDGEFWKVHGFEERYMKDRDRLRTWRDQHAKKVEY